MAGKKNRKKILFPIVAVVLALAIAVGCWFYFGRQSGESVYVYPFMHVGMTEYWGDQQESYGPVTTDNIQTVFLSSTQTVTEVSVAVGDTVKKGDLLMTYDTTLTDIALERERLKVEKLKLDLQDAYDYLAEINAMKPMVIPTTPEQPEEDVDLGVALTKEYSLSVQKEYDGSSVELALICWLADDTAVTDELLDSILATALEYRASHSVPLAKPGEDTEEEEVPAPEADGSSTYVVFKVTEGNMSLGQQLVWQGVFLTYDEIADTYQFRFYDASFFADHTLENAEAPDSSQPEIDLGSGYTAAQIAEMRSQQEKTIRDLQFQVKMAEADYKIKETEISDGKVLAQIDGTVVSVLSEEEALLNQQPMIKVSSGGGFYVEGSISELQKENLSIGQEVTVNDWNTGMVYTGLVESISDYPQANDGSYYGNGNPNISLYPFTVFIDGSADLQAGSYVSVMYSTASAESGIYLENPFLRTEHGKSYVFVQGADGLLEKRYVTTGKSLWGSYTEILSGLTPEDLIAFPYGKHVKAGAPAVESDLSTLYSY